MSDLHGGADRQKHMEQWNMKSWVWKWEVNLHFLQAQTLSEVLNRNQLWCLNWISNIGARWVYPNSGLDISGGNRFIGCSALVAIFEQQLKQSHFWKWEEMFMGANIKKIKIKINSVVWNKAKWKMYLLIWNGPTMPIFPPGHPVVGNRSALHVTKALPMPWGDPQAPQITNCSDPFYSPSWCLLHSLQERTR